MSDTTIEQAWKETNEAGKYLIELIAEYPGLKKAWKKLNKRERRDFRTNAEAIIFNCTNHARAQP